MYEYLFNFKLKKMYCICTIAHAYKNIFGAERVLLQYTLVSNLLQLKNDEFYFALILSYSNVCFNILLNYLKIKLVYFRPSKMQFAKALLDFNF